MYASVQAVLAHHGFDLPVPAGTGWDARRPLRVAVNAVYAYTATPLSPPELAADDRTDMITCTATACRASENEFVGGVVIFMMAALLFLPQWAQFTRTPSTPQIFGICTAPLRVPTARRRNYRGTRGTGAGAVRPVRPEPVRRAREPRHLVSAPASCCSGRGPADPHTGNGRQVYLDLPRISGEPHLKRHKRKRRRDQHDVARKRSQVGRLGRRRPLARGDQRVGIDAVSGSGQKGGAV